MLPRNCLLPAGGGWSSLPGTRGERIVDPSVWRANGNGQPCVYVSSLVERRRCACALRTRRPGPRRSFELHQFRERQRRRNSPVLVTQNESYINSARQIVQNVSAEPTMHDDNAATTPTRSCAELIEYKSPSPGKVCQMRLLF